jgi:iron complex outermembrane receptor protein
VNASRSVNLGFLPAPVSVAVGAALRWERFAITQGELASYVNGGYMNQYGEDPATGSQVFPGFSPSDASSHSRVNLGLFSELETNLTPKFLANVAGRFEDYSDFGMRMSGKLALRYQPARMLTLRAAASTGFRAPGLGQAYFSKVITNVIAGQTVDIGVFPVDHPAARALGSKPLREETAVNFSAGFAFTPLQNLTFTADYFRITINHRILLGATFDDDTSLAILARAGYGTIAGVQYFTNGLDTRTQGVDLTGDWQIPSFAGGTLNLTASANYSTNRITRVDQLPAVLANSSEPGLIDTVPIGARRSPRSTPWGRSTRCCAATTTAASGRPSRATATTAATATARRRSGTWSSATVSASSNSRSAPGTSPTSIPTSRRPSG